MAAMPLSQIAQCIHHWQTPSQERAGAQHGDLRMPYNVFLFDGTISARKDSGDKLSSDQLDAIQKQVQGYFNQVVARHDAAAGPKGKKHGGAIVRWITGPTVVGNSELLVYMMPFNYTVAKSGRLETGAPPPDHDGLTHPMADGVASEVYLHTSDTDILAKLIFHEAMHNKLAMGNEMHPKAGLAASPVGPNSALSQPNIADMAAALDRDRPQWTAGIQLLISESQRSDNDPLKGLL